MYLRSIVFLGSKNDRYGGLRQPTANFDSRLSLYKTQKGTPSRNSGFWERSLAFLRFVLEFCRPRGSKKERCFCCVARCFLQTAFAISTPVSFLCIFPSFHLVVKERQGAVPMAERYFAFLRILFPEDTSGSPPTIKLRLKARQPAASFSISKPKLLEWESKWPVSTHLGPTRPHRSPSAASLIRSIRFTQVEPPCALASTRRLNRQ